MPEAQRKSFGEWLSELSGKAINGLYEGLENARQDVRYKFEHAIYGRVVTPEFGAEGIHGPNARAEPHGVHGAPVSPQDKEKLHGIYREADLSGDDRQMMADVYADTKGTNVGREIEYHEAHHPYSHADAPNLTSRSEAREQHEKGVEEGRAAERAENMRGANLYMGPTEQDGPGSDIDR